MLETIALFPIDAVLFPCGRMPLKIFEPRYLDLVSACLKGDSGFGVVHLQEGREVSAVAAESETKFAKIGTYAKIIDFDGFPDGTLGTTIEGRNKFKILSSWQEKSLLYRAEIKWIDDEKTLPLLENFSELKVLLNQLMEHPKLQQLNFDEQVTDLTTLSFLLSQFLPINTTEQYEYLCLEEPLGRLEKIVTYLDEISS